MTHPAYSKTKKFTLLQKARAVGSLTRWREHVPYTIPVVVCGALMSAYANGFVLDWRLLPVLLANILAMSFAFMINDVQDAPDDARDPHKREHNVISQGILSFGEGAGVAFAFFGLALALYVPGGWKTFATGGLVLVLSYLYSASPFRLKALPVVDILSHALMLGGLLMLSGYLIYHAYPDSAWLMIASVTLGSAYGQFYNQVDDFETDKRAGLRNTAMLVGKKPALVMMYGSITGAVLTFAGAVLLNTFPLWLGPIALVVIFTLALFRWNIDMRGGETDTSGMVQVPVLIAANIVVLIWLVQEMGLLTIAA